MKTKTCANCADPIISCGDCDAKGIILNWEEAQDCLSAIGVWLRRLEGPKLGKDGAKETIKDLKKLEKKLWKLKHE